MVEARHHRALGDIQRPGDLLVGELLELTQGEDLPVTRGQPLERALQERGALALHRMGGGARREVDDLEVHVLAVAVDAGEGGLLEPSVLAQEAEAGVPQDAVEPGEEGLGRVVGGPGPEDLQEGLLTQLHGVLAGAHEGPGHLEGSPAEGALQVTEGLVVALADSRHEPCRLALHVSLPVRLPRTRIHGFLVLGARIGGGHGGGGRRGGGGGRRSGRGSQHRRRRRRR